MAVRCTGETKLLEQLGEKQDFECLLTALGLRHEEFALYVRRVARTSLGKGCVYAVTVAREGHDGCHVYLGGPAYSWTERFAAQAMRGFFGCPGSPAGTMKVEWRGSDSSLRAR